MKFKDLLHKLYVMKLEKQPFGKRHRTKRTQVKMENTSVSQKEGEAAGNRVVVWRLTLVS